jgi:hypothetical protein
MAVFRVTKVPKAKKSKVEKLPGYLSNIPDHSLLIMRIRKVKKCP